jgi:hypothetical protein
LFCGFASFCWIRSVCRLFSPHPCITLLLASSDWFPCYKMARRNTKKERKRGSQERGSLNCVRCVCVCALSLVSPVLLLRDKAVRHYAHTHGHSEVNWMEKQSIKTPCPIFHAIFQSPFHMKRLPLFISNLTYGCRYFLFPLLLRLVRLLISWDLKTDK